MPCTVKLKHTIKHVFKGFYNKCAQTKMLVNKQNLIRIGVQCMCKNDFQ